MLLHHLYNDTAVITCPPHPSIVAGYVLSRNTLISQHEYVLAAALPCCQTTHTCRTLARRGLAVTP